MTTDHEEAVHVAVFILLRADEMRQNRLSYMEAARQTTGFDKRFNVAMARGANHRMISLHRMWTQLKETYQL